MSPPYPRVAPTYKRADDSEMIKLDLLLFLPVERSVGYLLCKVIRYITERGLNNFAMKTNSIYMLLFS